MSSCPGRKRGGSAARLAAVMIPAVLALAGVFIGAPSSVFGEDAPKLYVHIETPGRFSYSGDPTQVSILVKNEGAASWTNPGLDIEGGFQVFDGAGNKLEKGK